MRFADRLGMMSHHAAYFSTSAAPLRSSSVRPQQSVTWQLASLHGKEHRSVLTVLHPLRRTNWPSLQRYFSPSSLPLICASGKDDSMQQIQKIIGQICPSLLDEGRRFGTGGKIRGSLREKIISCSSDWQGGLSRKKIKPDLVLPRQMLKPVLVWSIFQVP